MKLGELGKVSLGFYKLRLTFQSSPNSPNFNIPKLTSPNLPDFNILKLISPNSCTS